MKEKKLCKVMRAKHRAAIEQEEMEQRVLEAAKVGASRSTFGPSATFDDKDLARGSYPNGPSDAYGILGIFFSLLYFVF